MSEIGECKNGLTCVKTGSNKTRFEYCLESMGDILYTQALEGHYGGDRVDPTLQNIVEIPFGWIEHILSELVLR